MISYALFYPRTRTRDVIAVAGHNEIGVKPGGSVVSNSSPRGSGRVSYPKAVLRQPGEEGNETVGLIPVTPLGRTEEIARLILYNEITCICAARSRNRICLESPVARPVTRERIPLSLFLLGSLGKTPVLLASRCEKISTRKLYSNGN